MATFSGLPKMFLATRFEKVKIHTDLQHKLLYSAADLKQFVSDPYPATDPPCREVSDPNSNSYKDL